MTGDSGFDAAELTKISTSVADAGDADDDDAFQGTDSKTRDEGWPIYSRETANKMWEDRAEEAGVEEA